MKSLLILAAAAAIAPAFAACGSTDTQQQAVDQDEKTLQQLGDDGPAAIAEPGTRGVTENGDTVVKIIDDVDIK